MKTIKRILMPVLVCMIALFALTACGSSSSGYSGTAEGKIIISTLTSSGITGVTETEELDKAVAAYADALESASLTYAESIKAAVDDDEDYDTAKAAAQNTKNAALKPYVASNVVIFGYVCKDGATASDTAKRDANKLLTYSVENSKTIKTIGCATGVEYDYDEDTGEVVTKDKVFVAVIFE